MNQNQETRIAFVKAGWHADLVDQACEGFVDGLKNEIPVSNIEVIDVPGSLEIPLRAKTLAESGRYQCIVAAGLIVDGGIYRHDFVAQAVLDGMMRVQLDTSVPILSVVLTPHNFQETEQYLKFFSEHLRLKGLEAAKACLQLLEDDRQLRDVA